MLNSLNSAVSGLQQFQSELDVIGNNIANADTTGFKAGRADFEDAFSQTLRAAGINSADGIQIGSGVSTATVSNNFTQGSLTNTGIPSDLAIVGDGFFIVRNAVSGEQFATRAGDFTLDANGYLITSDGYRLQGYGDAGLSTTGDLRIDTTGMPGSAAAGATVQSYHINNDGKINVALSDGTSFVRGQVLLQDFVNPNALLKSGSNLYSGLSAAGPMSSSAVPGTAGLGLLRSEALELSNVDLTTELSNLITTQRAFQANARVITTSDEVLQELVNLKR